MVPVVFVVDVTVVDAARIWMSRVEANGMRHRGPVERGTLAQYRQHVDLHILPHIGKLKLPNLTHQAIKGFRDALLQDEAMSRAMARKVLVSLKSLLKANNCAHLADDVAIGTDARTQASARDRPRHPDPRRDRPADRGRCAERENARPPAGGGAVRLARLRAARPALVRRRPQGRRANGLSLAHLCTLTLPGKHTLAGAPICKFTGSLPPTGPPVRDERGYLCEQPSMRFRCRRVQSGYGRDNQA
jgi:Phage integrase, N-terminal SAM-like domain